MFYLLSRMGILFFERSKILMLFDIGLINGKGVCVVLINGRIIKVIVDNIMVELKLIRYYI